MATQPGRSLVLFPDETAEQPIYRIRILLMFFCSLPEAPIRAVPDEESDHDGFKVTRTLDITAIMRAWFVSAR